MYRWLLLLCTRFSIRVHVKNFLAVCPHNNNIYYYHCYYYYSFNLIISPPALCPRLQEEFAYLRSTYTTSKNYFENEDWRGMRFRSMTNSGLLRRNRRRLVRKLH